MDLPENLRRFEPFWGQWYAERLLGEGSYGSVYLIAREEYGDRYEAALKWIPLPRNESDIQAYRAKGKSDEDIAAYYKDMMLKLRSEIKLMNQFHGNGHIVCLEDHVIKAREGGIGYDVLIRMELLSTLVSEAKKLKVGDVVQMGIDLCMALEDCAKRGIIHRDIKTENIFRTSFGVFKLGDFGVARQLESASSALSRRGTPLYMAPEVYAGREYDARVDLYSLGLVMYELLNAHTIPFAEISPGIMTVSEQENAFEKRMKGEQMPPPCQCGDTPLGRVILKACAYRPEDRYQSATEFRRALEECRREEICADALYDDGIAAPSRRTPTGVKPQLGREQAIPMPPVGGMENGPMQDEPKASGSQVSGSQPGGPKPFVPQMDAYNATMPMGSASFEAADSARQNNSDEEKLKPDPNGTLPMDSPLFQEAQADPTKTMPLQPGFAKTEDAEKSEEPLHHVMVYKRRKMYKHEKLLDAIVVYTYFTNSLIDTVQNYDSLVMFTFVYCIVLLALLLCAKACLWDDEAMPCQKVPVSASFARWIMIIGGSFELIMTAAELAEGSLGSDSMVFIIMAIQTACSILKIYVGVQSRKRVVKEKEANEKLIAEQNGQVEAKA